MDPSRRSKLREELRADAGRLASLAERHGTPLLVLQPHLVARRYRQLTARLAGFRLHYAVKASPHPVVLSTIAICGGGFDVATSAEIALLQRLGLPMDRCIHTNPIKKPVDIDAAYAAGIRTFVVENACKAKKFAGGPADAELLVKHVISVGAQFAGFSFHVGSQTPSPQPYGTALRGTLDLIAHIGESLGVHSRVIDIGGGFPVAYREPMPTIDAIADVIDGALGPARDDFTFLAEPDGQVWHYLDDGVYGSYSNVMTEDVHPPILALRELTEDGSAEYELVTLAGPTCDSARRDRP